MDFDRQWNNVGNQRLASYTNLPPGNYTFNVKAVNENDIETQASIDIISKSTILENIYMHIPSIPLLF